VEAHVQREKADATLALPALRVSVAAARRTVTALCAPAGLDELCDVAALLTSEVVTNAVLHGDGTVVVRAHTDRGMLRVEVQDEGSGTPVLQEVARDAEGGRGLALVAALADRWGVESVSDGKYVWFELTRGAASAIDGST
jgi:anti-sigma regulatory factor (Ser/Thr protein kinase)